MSHRHDYELVEELRCPEWVFRVLCLMFPPGASRKWMLVQPFRRLLFRPVPPSRSEGGRA